MHEQCDQTATGGPFSFRCSVVFVFLCRPFERCFYYLFFLLVFAQLGASSNLVSPQDTLKRSHETVAATYQEAQRNVCCQFASTRCRGYTLQVQLQVHQMVHPAPISRDILMLLQIQYSLDRSTLLSIQLVHGLRTSFLRRRGVIAEGVSPRAWDEGGGLDMHRFLVQRVW